MKIRKVGHCCLVIEEGGVRFLTDPGAFSQGQNEVEGLHAVLITHEHADHLHVESLKQVIERNPDARVISNAAVGEILGAAGVQHEVISDKAIIEVDGVTIEAFDCKHEEIFEEFGQVPNTGYLIAGTLLFPGDAYLLPGKPVDVLALPVAGPWCKISDAIRYALSVAPRAVFPMHDGQLRDDRIGGSHAVPAKVLGEHGITFVALKAGESADF